MAQMGIPLGEWNGAQATERLRQTIVEALIRQSHRQSAARPAAELGLAQAPVLTSQNK